MQSKTIESVRDTDKTIIRLKPFGVDLRVDLPIELKSQFTRKCPIYLPMNNVCLTTPQVIEINVAWGKPSLTIEEYKATFKSNATDSMIVADTLLIASRLVEKVLNQNNIFSLHASSLSYNNQAVLLIGAYGSGKTTTAVNLCMKDKTIGYVTGNRPFLQNSNNKILYGMGHISVCTSSLVEELHIKDEVLKNIGFNSKNTNPYYAIQASRISFDASILNITKACFPLNLKAIIFVKKSDREFVLFKSDRTNERDIMAIYYALREYSEKNYVMIGPKIILPDIVTEQEKYIRLEYAEKLAKSTPIIYAEGKLDALSSFVKSILRE
ncbi:hypothetical protein M1141_02745 [Candidatus Marsarchaeota archaeon]|nr:hypothetical protein [Candidatus Marsarchaeota archaeon]